MKRYIKDNKIKFDKEIIVYVGGKQIVNPREEQLLADGWVEYVPPVVEPYKPPYEELVEMYIRDKYSVSDELAVLRQRDTKPDEYNEYFAYCEECKRRAKEEI